MTVYLQPREFLIFYVGLSNPILNFNPNSAENPICLTNNQLFYYFFVLLIAPPPRYKKTDPDSGFSLDFGCLYGRCLIGPLLKPVNFIFWESTDASIAFYNVQIANKSFFSLTFCSKFRIFASFYRFAEHF